MDTYSFLRELADSWALLALFLIFLGAIAWLWRPGSRALHSDAGLVPFRHDEAPPAGAPALSAQPCGRGCDGCGCGQATEVLP